MCLPVKFLEKIVKLNAGLITVLGCLATIVGFSFSLNLSDFVDIPVEAAFYWFSMCILMVAFGSHGLCNKKRNSQCSLICYNIVLICSMLCVIVVIVIVAFIRILLGKSI